MTSRERVLSALRHQQPDAIPVDFGSTFITGMHVSVVAALRDQYGLERRPVRVLDPQQMLGEVDDELKQIIGVDVEGVFRRTTKYGFPAVDWKTWRMPDGLEVLVPGQFHVTYDANGDVLMHPQGDTSVPPSGRMPNDGYFFDNIIRQQPFDEDRLDPLDNLEEFQPIPDHEIAWLEQRATAARESGRAVMASFGGLALGDINMVPGMGLKHPRGIRDIAEWYMSTRSRRDYVYRVFAGQTRIALENLERIAARLRDLVDIVVTCTTDFGTQSSSFCSVETFRQLWIPHYLELNRWIHAHTPWRIFKHSCGAVAKFIPSFLEAGFDILNPVQCSAAGMDPFELKNRYGGQVVFWGGGVDTQHTLAFGSPDEVRDQVLRRCEIFGPGGGFVFNAIHNVQARTPVANLAAMFDAVREFNGRPMTAAVAVQ